MYIYEAIHFFLSQRMIKTDFSIVYRFLKRWDRRGPYSKFNILALNLG